MKRRPLILALAVALPTVLLGVGWLWASMREQAALHREQLRMLTRTADAVRGAVDESLEELRGREDGRPFYVYNTLYNPPEVVSVVDPVARSPLAGDPEDRRIVGYFQVLPGGTVRTPYAEGQPDPRESPRGARVMKLAASPAFAEVRSVTEAGPEEIRPEPVESASSYPSSRVSDWLSSGPSSWRSGEARRRSRPRPSPRPSPQPAEAPSAEELRPQGPLTVNLDTWNQGVYDDIQQAQAGDQEANRRVLERGRAAPITRRNTLSWDEVRESQRAVRGDRGGMRQRSGSGSNRAEGPEKRPQPPAPSEPPAPAWPLRGTEAEVDYTPMAWRSAGENLVLHRLVAHEGTAVVQGVIIDRRYLIDEWIPSLIRRHAVFGVEPRVVEGASEGECIIRRPVSGVLDDVYLCYPPGSLNRISGGRLEALGGVLVSLELAALGGLVLIVTLAGLAMYRATRRAEELSSQKSAFISAVSHELRTPLTTIRMHAEMLRDGLVSSRKRPRFHEQLVHESVRLSHLVDNVLELSRLEEGRRVLRPHQADLRAAVSEAVEGQRSFIESKGFQLVGPDSGEAAGPITVSFDGQALAQIVVNLLDNAVKYGRGETQRIEVAVAVERDGAVLSVRDHGPGVPERERDKVFERFHRVEAPGRAHMPGTGIGLCLVRELARAHGGEAEVREPPDGGCEVRVMLPELNKGPSTAALGAGGALVSLLLCSLLTACGSPPSPPHDAGPDGGTDADQAEADADDGGDADTDPDIEGDGDADPDEGETPPALSGAIEVRDGSEGAVVIELTEADGEGCGEPLRFVVETGAFALPSAEVPEGRYGLLAWLDEDGDGRWDGIWEGSGEPAARLGLSLPREDLRLVLRRGVPEPVLDSAPEWVELYHRAWEAAERHIAAGTPENGLADHYMDEAFSEQIFQWDTCFMTIFGRYGLDAFPVMSSLDNFYGAQEPDGHIDRVVNESDGSPGCDGHPCVNPPLFGWTELMYARQSGDLSRIPCVLPVLRAYHGWIDDNLRTGPGLYYTDHLGSGMDNAPREPYDGWVDITAQQALGRRALAELERLIGLDDEAAADEAEAERICRDIREMMWNDAEGFFFDLAGDLAFEPNKTLAGIWPLVAGCATAEQAARAIAHLEDPAAFWRVHVFPSAAADSIADGDIAPPAYDPRGGYWRGGVWAPTNYATIVALDRAGRHDVAQRAAANHIGNLERIWSWFAPGPDQLSPEARGDGRHTFWELYAPDLVAPGTRWDGELLGRQDFVGWSGLGPIALLIEQVIGLEADGLADRLRWRLTRVDRHGVRGYRFGDQLVDLVAEARDDPRDPLRIELESTDPFTLVIEVGEREWAFEVPEGPSTVELDPAGVELSGSPIPAGPHVGYAVLGNGRISAVITDDPANGAPGLSHLYRGSFGQDLVESARPVVVREGEELRGGRAWLDPFFAANAQRDLPGRGAVTWRAFVGADDVVIWQGALVAGSEDARVRLAPYVRLREGPHIDGSLEPAGLSTHERGLIASYSDGSALALGISPAPAGHQAGEISRDQLLGGLGGAIEPGRELALELDLEALAGTATPFRLALASGDSEPEALDALARALDAPDPLEEAREHWSGWSPEAACGAGSDRCRIAAANLYAARASSLGGQVPADLTGQFLTNGFPQLYPRDALMVARAFALHGHLDEAWEIVGDWLDPERERRSPGEWYARYDALGRAVDGGSGARYDVPEWDANGYLALLVERLGPERLSGAEREALLEALDFLVARQDDEGLFSEGGIVEWVGRLPATAMTNWAGLDAGARLARRWGEDERARDYLAAAGRIRGGLVRLFDMRRMILADERPETGLEYDSSLLFGPALGFPASPLLDSTFDWLSENATALGGGVRYFEGGAWEYGQDLFFFTTAAAAQYAAILGDLDRAGRFLGWMTAETNRYGLAPERVHQDHSGAAEATPLSWCAAELAVAVRAVREAEARADLPAVDGEVTSAEYRGRVSVDHDGAPDAAGDPVALTTAVDGDDLYVGVLVAGELAAISSAATYTVYLSGTDGLGPVARSEGGRWLGFRAAPDHEPGAAARIRLDPGRRSCSCGEAAGEGFAERACEAASFGERAMEARLGLASLGLAGPVQAILIAETGEGERALPAYGSHLTGEAAGGVLVTFEVDASAVAGELDPAAGVIVTLSGDGAELGGWAPHHLALRDDGRLGDETADDQVWTVVVELAEGRRIAFKYLIGEVGEGSWEGDEFPGGGANRESWTRDPDASGRTRLRHVFAERGELLLDP